ncbi:hypothetical protein ACFVWX_25135 [Streptomyces sp. NPDC058220]|uniref:hypothetical protein n=1 Tax=Streptomyces sp. NPDC058220 TaxID=3346387 RepID=UPI0036E1E2B9
MARDVNLAIFITGPCRLNYARNRSEKRRECRSRLADRIEKGLQTVFLQLVETGSPWAVALVGIVFVVLAVARVVKNLPRDTIGKFFDHRTNKYEIIARDAKGRVAQVQKQRLVFLAFLCVCCVAVALFWVNTTERKSEPPSKSAPASSVGASLAQ